MRPPDGRRLFTFFCGFSDQMTIVETNTTLWYKLYLIAILKFESFKAFKLYVQIRWNKRFSINKDMPLVPRSTGTEKRLQFFWRLSCLANLIIRFLFILSQMAPFYYNYLRIKAQLLNVYLFQKVDMTTFLADIKCEIDGGYSQFGIYPAPWRTTPGK